MKRYKKPTKMKSRTQKEIADEETSAVSDVEARVILTPVKCRSRAGSNCSSIVEVVPRTRAAAKEMRRNSLDNVCLEKSETSGVLC